VHTRRALTVAAASVLFTLAPALAASAAPAPGGCQAFGNNVAFLANTVAPNGAFGGITSGTAQNGGSSGLPNVVTTEQQALCHSGG
jgi:hypothetical protein